MILAELTSSQWAMVVGGWAVFYLVPALALAGIFRKAGYSVLLTITQLVPVVNILVLLIVAFTDWPLEQELRKTRKLLVQDTL